MATGTYRATARRDGKAWLVTVDNVGVTQGRNLEDARAMASTLITAVTHAEPGTFTVDFQAVIPDELQLEVDHARAAVAALDAAQREAAVMSRQVVAALKGAGFSGKDAAFILGVSEQRVSQLARPPQ